MTEIFTTSPINLKPEVLKAAHGRKRYFIKADHARRFYHGNRHLDITDTQQQVADEVIAFLRNDYRYKGDFAEAEPVQSQAEAEPEAKADAEPVAVQSDTESETVVVEFDYSDTLHIEAYGGVMLFDRIGLEDFEVMSLAELNAYVKHFNIDVGRATAETTIRERVEEWYANTG